MDYDDDIEMPNCDPINDENETIEMESNVDSTPFDAVDRSIATSVVKRGRKNFINARLVAALDNAKVSDGMAVHILIAAAEALGHRVEELVINRSSIHRMRQENRLREYKEISSNFSDNVI